MLPDGLVQRLRIRTARGNSAALRLAVSRQLGSADLRIPEVSPSAILLVRKLTDPLPGRVSTHPSAVLLDAAWERALRRELQSLRAHAVRPRDGRIDGDSQSLLFADEAELLACVALSLIGEHGPPAWWRQALARHLRAASVHELLGGQIELLPAVFAVLARWHKAEDVAASLAEPAARELVARLARAAGAPLLLETRAPIFTQHDRDARADARPALPVAGEPDAMPAGAREENAAEPAIVRVAGRDAHFAPPVLAPWRSSWRPNSASRLTPVQQLLVGFALTLQRAPGRACSSAFAAQAQRWLQCQGSAPMPMQSAAPAQRAESIAQLSAVGAQPTGAPQPPAQRPAKVRAARTRADGAADRRSEHTSRSAEAAQRRTRAEARKQHAPPVAAEARPAPPVHDPVRQNVASEALVSEPQLAIEDGAPRWSEQGLLTSLGGLLYLVNLMEALDLPQCFEQACGMASTVGALSTLEAIARALLRPLPAQLDEDPIWSLLAQLDGRAPKEPPRAEGLRAGALRLPPAWLAAESGAPHALRWSAEGSRLCLWSDAGYLLIDVPLQACARRQALAELSRYPVGALRGLLEPGAHGSRPRADLTDLREARWPEPLVRWLEFVTPFLRWRVARALGESATLDLVEELARCPARVHVSDTHIDVVASIESARLPLRLSGLDRSPGWVARLQRVVLFHFE
jgi:hypothetical protein